MIKPDNEGMMYYWFNGEEFTTAWFRQQLENVISDLGSRYSPELNVQLEISKKFEYLRGYSRKGIGRGLGLYNVKKISEQYGAVIECRNMTIDHRNWISFKIKVQKPTNS